jgi:acetolactate synthase-1/2/3 large subunit
MRAADLLVHSLISHGLKRVWCVPGESYLALLDALAGSALQTVVCRHESGAGFMAVAEAKLTGRPGVFMVSRGPGATNASIALHVAEQDATPLVMLVGQVSRRERERGAFQEIEYKRFFGAIAKGVFELHDAKKTGETIVRAMHLAASGVPGPVVIALPEDVLEDEAGDAAPRPCPIARPRHAAQDVAALQSLIDSAERPLCLAGGIMRGLHGAAALQRFADAQRIPVAVTWKNQDVFDNTSPLYAGHVGVGFAARYRDLLSQADLIIAAGTRLGDIATFGYSLPSAPEPKQRLVHIYPDAGPIGRVIRADIGIIADPVTLLDDLGQRAWVAASSREAWISSLNGYVRDIMAFTPRAVDDGVDFGEVTLAVAKAAPVDAIVTTDAGNMSTWVHRHWPMTPKNTLLGAIAGAMGFGVPAAVAASLEQPGRMAIAFVGDGGCLMTGQELATAMQHGGKPKIILSDNASYGTIRLHQERHYPGRVSGTELKNPDLTQWAKSFGAHAVTIERGDDIAAKVRDALAFDGAAVIHAKSSRESLSAGATLSSLAS